MDANRKNKSNWYFFRQRMKRRREVHKQMCDQLLSQSRICEEYRLKMNSTARSFSQSLTEISYLHRSVEGLNQIYNILKVRIQNFQQMVENYKSQIQIYKSQLSHHPKLAKRLGSNRSTSSDDDAYLPPGNDSDDTPQNLLDPDLPSLYCVKYNPSGCALKRLWFIPQSKIPNEVLHVHMMMSSSITKTFT
eukprot:TRINITY_DN510_c0_g1_i1.p1 TRINITY_DN510_c0_g1~~TRINITY_DN510_c0_g1_i1.p1  ORF type:complete len:191 (-),score=13.83 TRINITY_DN510_c0_g1_i1:98-670(-)